MPVRTGGPPSRASTWELTFFLPNLKLPVPSPLATEWVELVAGEDPKVKRLRNTAANKTGRRMLRRFSTVFGDPYHPAVMLVRTNAPATVLREATLLAFRDLAAAATIGDGVALTIPSSMTTWLPVYSDHFVFADHWAVGSGEIAPIAGIVHDTPIPGIGERDEKRRYHGHPTPGISTPHFFESTVDLSLFQRLTEAWSRAYVKGDQSESFQRLFRSLNVAFQAARFPSDGPPTDHDVGTRLGLWVSAFEILFHPGGRRQVNKLDVVTGLERLKWLTEILGEPRFTVQYKGEKRPVGFAAALYDEIYGARNRYMHGDPVSDEHQFTRFCRQKLPLLHLSPVLYSAALRVALDTLVGPLDEERQLHDEMVHFGAIETAFEYLLTAESRVPGEENPWWVPPPL